MLARALFTLAALALISCSDNDAAKSAATSPLADIDDASETEAPNDDRRYEVKPADAASLNALGKGFVQMALALGQHDGEYVDAYHGPEEWAVTAAAEKRSLAALEADAQGHLISLARSNKNGASVRGAMLEKLTRAALARIQMLQGRVFSFDEETKAIYDVVAPQYDLADFEAALAEIDALLPGEASVDQKVNEFRQRLIVPEDKLRVVMEAAIAECRARTLAHYDLPEGEGFSLEFVKDKSWNGYNLYKGDYQSHIQINTDHPIEIDWAVELGCHEAYPGHHTWGVMVEDTLVREKGWVEYSIYPLFSPLSVVAEGSANYGVDLAFPGEQRLAFERDVLFPLAGLDPEDAELLAQISQSQRKLSHIRNYVGREYLDGRISAEEAIGLLMKYRLEPRGRAEQTLAFIETYRGYVINYSLGYDIVRQYVEAGAAAGREPWVVFESLLTTPLSAAQIEAAAKAL